ncbi:Tripartite motif-containing protein 26 [Hypsizygus marmoreus]|uniref:Tripartite motif-containing protein 26 n=1 Tax=Hypsizygus marmoreus TaxID=39966 RepID=A0A369J1U6_HYPMA|nr:Tripartite motif-containing protein 26 [Hypsizygus marmoreus]
MSGECSICLTAFKDPVSIPCGHVYCTKCLADHVNAPGNNDLRSTCPTCRRPFNTVTPDLTYLHKKYHEYVVPSVRRIYFDNPAQVDVKMKLAVAEAKIKKLQKEQEVLMRQCERHIAAAGAHAAGEQQAKLKADNLAERLSNIEREHKNEKLGAVLNLMNIEEQRDVLNTKYQKLKQRVHDLEMNSRLNDSMVSTSSSHGQRLHKMPSSLRIDTSMSAGPSRHAEAPAVASNSSASRPIRPLPRAAREKVRAQARRISPPPIFREPAKRPRLSEPLVAVGWALQEEPDDASLWNGHYSLRGRRISRAG